MEGSAQIRSAFLDYFEREGHTTVPTSSLVPAADATLLFTNAGMVQFKDVFLGNESLPYVRATSSQRCVRAGGKHNDLENVGYTARHHTFFEMLGNFSFGDYFKREAIQYAWEFLTEVVKLPKEKLWVTVFEEDDEAAKIWIEEIGVDPVRLSRIGAKDNFWSMGDTGPCGPCTEIFYDHGESIPGGPPGTPEEDGDRYIEIWNLVFMQFDRSQDGTLTPLPKPSVDTGMGLERLAAILQNVHSNYEIDLFQHLIKAAAEATQTTDLQASSLKVIADHIRSCAFLITDGVYPSNEGRGYVLRRIIRRAARHGNKLGMKDLFFHKLVEPLVAEMGEAYPELAAAKSKVAKILKIEEERFFETLEQGMKMLEQHIQENDGKELAGDVVFKLYDTYGFPVDLTADIARERNLTVDQAGFERHMEAQRQRARSANQFTSDSAADIARDISSEFKGYDSLVCESEVNGVYLADKAATELKTDETGMVFLQQTAFYAESGGQVGDTGQLISPDGEVLFDVTDTQKRGNGAIAHIGTVQKGIVKSGTKLIAKVDRARREAVILNHSATHLLHAALKIVLGEHVLQKGSLVNEQRLRFDFTHFEPVTPSELQQVELLVNREIRQNLLRSADEMAYTDAVESGAMALFEEKYGDLVRVIKFGDFSVELCGGTHVTRTGDIGLFKIVTETGIASGVRRIEALTGEVAANWVTAQEQAMRDVAALLKTSNDAILDKIKQTLDRNKALEKALEAAQSKLASNASSNLTDNVVNIDGINVLAAKLETGDAKVLREMVDKLKDKLGSAAVILGGVDGDKVKLVAGVSKDCINRVKAGELVNSVALKVGGKGGGRPDMAQAGGNDPAALVAALAEVPEWVRSQLPK